MPALSTAIVPPCSSTRFLRDREAEAEAAARPLQRLLALDEALEDARQQLGRDADALVVDAQRRRVAVAARARCAMRWSARENLTALVSRLQITCVSRTGSPLTQTGASGPRHLGRPAAPSQHRLGELERARDDVAQVDALAAQLDLARGDARHVEQVVDHARQVRDLALDDAALARVGRRRRGAP